MERRTKKCRTNHSAWALTRSRECPWCRQANINIETGTCRQCGTAVAGFGWKRRALVRQRGQRGKEAA